MPQVGQPRVVIQRHVEYTDYQKDPAHYRRLAYRDGVCLVVTRQGVIIAQFNRLGAKYQD